MEGASFDDEEGAYNDIYIFIQSFGGPARNNSCWLDLVTIIHRPSAVALAFWVSLGAPRTERSSWDNRKVTHFGAVKSSLATLSQPTVHAKPSKHPKRNSQRKEHLVSSTYPASLKFGGSDSSWLAKSSSYCLQFQCSRVLSRIIKRIDISSKQKLKPSPVLASWRQEIIWSTFSKKTQATFKTCRSSGARWLSPDPFAEKMTFPSCFP